MTVQSSTGLQGCVSRCLLPGLLCIPLLAAGCDKVPLLAPTGSTIALFSTSPSLPLNGSTEIVATVIEDAGTPVHNGTVVTFTATLGTVEPAEARTNGGKVTVRFTASSRSGTATITAFSGPASADTTIEIEAPPPPPIVAISAAGNATQGEPVTFTLTVTPPTGEGGAQPVTRINDVRIEFGDGQSRSLGAVSGDMTVGHVYQSAGTFQARATATDSLGQTSTASTILVVSPAAPINVTITVHTATPTVGEPVMFEANVPDTPIQSYQWSFGDGTGRTTSGSETSKTYAAAGTYLVRVTVTSADGRQASGEREIRVVP